MFEPAILQSLEASMPPQPPAAIVESWVSPAGTAARRVSDRLADSYDALAAEWLAEMDAVRSQAEAIEISTTEPSDLTIIENLIADYETHADLRALTSARLRKQVRREVTKQFKVDPSIGAVTRELGARLIATDKKIVDALLDYALMLRAIRAEISAKARGGPVFDDPEALARHLDSLVA